MIYIIILAIVLGIALIARYAKAGVGFPKKKSFAEQIFFDAAAFLQGWFGGKKGGKNALREVERIKLFLLVFVAGDIVAMFLWISGDGVPKLVDGAQIYRRKAGEGSEQVRLLAKGTSGREAEVTVTVAECLYEDARLQVLYEEMVKELETAVLGENSSWDCVTQDLHFEEEVEGYPFSLSWRSDNFAFLSSGGEVATWQEAAAFEEQEAVVAVTMRAEYRDFIREHVFFARICPLEGEKTFADEVAYALEEAEKKDEAIEALSLPQKIGEEKINWKEVKEDSGKTFFLLGTVGALAVSLFSERDFRKEQEKKGAEMVDAYPAVISKLTLYLGAGMNLKNSFEKVASDGTGGFSEEESGGMKNSVYQEMAVACREMGSGIAEGEAYQRFGSRINKKQYIRLATLLVQNLNKGNAALLLQLKQEAYLALEEKNMAIRKIGEETGTKLLVPMILMMAMVMVLIMVPAFLTI